MLFAGGWNTTYWAYACGLCVLVPDVFGAPSLHVWWPVVWSGVYTPIQPIPDVLTMLVLSESSESLVSSLLLEGGCDLPPRLCEIQFHLWAVILEVAAP